MREQSLNSKDEKESIMRSLMPYGYRLFNGATLADCQVDSYNAIQRTINSFIDAGIRVPDYLLNGSHNLLSSYVKSLKGELAS